MALFDSYYDPSTYGAGSGLFSRLLGVQLSPDDVAHLSSEAA